MPVEIELKLLPEEAFNEILIRKKLVKITGLDDEEIGVVRYLKRSVDARKKPIYLLRMQVYRKGEAMEDAVAGFRLQAGALKKRIAVVGFGPAGIFAAMQLIENGYYPIVIERGKRVRERRRDLAILNKELMVDPESNYCFGEGGAGTYSDGKLYTRSKKRGDIRKVLQTFVDYGADPDILVDAHPHIGTNKLPGIIENMREALLKAGADIRFNAKLSGLEISGDRIRSIVVNETESLAVDALILATGHSARDIFELLHQHKLQLQAKPFALGLRIEHPQALIDEIQYGVKDRGTYLPPASYSLVTQAGGNGVFSFCMCPGGIIAPAATGQREVVVNGWSPSKRNGKFANSGMVVSVEEKHWQKEFGTGPLSALGFQKKVELAAWNINKSIVAPAQRMEDFIVNRISQNLPECSYLPGVHSADLNRILPAFIANSLRDGLTHFGKSMKGYRSNEAILLGVESRTSSPVRIPRDKISLKHTQIDNLYPCGEGAGYAGGIVSAALDGMAVAEAVGV